MSTYRVDFEKTNRTEQLLIQHIGPVCYMREDSVFRTGMMIEILKMYVFYKKVNKNLKMKSGYDIVL